MAARPQGHGGDALENWEEAQPHTARAQPAPDRPCLQRPRVRPSTSLCAPCASQNHLRDPWGSPSRCLRGNTAKFIPSLNTHKVYTSVLLTPIVGVAGPGLDLLGSGQVQARFSGGWK